MPTLARPTAPIADPVQRNRNNFVDSLMNVAAINQNAVSNFIAATNSTTKGVDVSFSIVNNSGVGLVSLLRASVLDISQATVLQTWTGGQAKFAWSDTDATLQQVPQVYYWVRLEPKSQAAQAKEVTVGPQNVLLNPTFLPPLPLDNMSASHAAAVNGAVLVTCNVSAVPSGDSVKIYVTGYHGSSTPVAVAQRAQGPLQFNLDATGETVTLEAIAVSSGGAEAATGPTATLTLSGTATVPAAPQNVQVVQISTGNQVSWPSSLEAGVANYSLYRAQRGAVFGSATLLATVSPTTASTVIYLDTGGLGGDYEYFVKVTTGAGTSGPSPAAFPPVQFSSATLPSNVPTNTTNTATVDSIDAGTNATVRIYGPGGVGTTYLRYTGYAPSGLSRPAGTISGLAYSTSYWVMYEPNTGYLTTTNFFSALPDGFEWVGQIKTVASGGTGGTSGGGGSAGGPAGCVEEGTDVVEPEGTIAVFEPCSDWIVLDLGEGPLKMHPDTLVSVWKKAKHLQKDDQIEVIGAGWRKPQSIFMEYRPSVKVKRTCPGGTYHAGPSKVRLHNVKYVG